MCEHYFQCWGVGGGLGSGWRAGEWVECQSACVRSCGSHCLPVMCREAGDQPSVEGDIQLLFLPSGREQVFINFHHWLYTTALGTVEATCTEYWN